MLNALQTFLIEKKANEMSNEEIVSLMENLQVKVSFEEGLVLFMYDIRADFANPIVKNCRGIILYRDNWDIACYPFNKFGNYHESYADDIDWNTARVQEKVDGSIMKIWFNRLSNSWVISSNGCIFASKAPISAAYENFEQLFNSAVTKVNYDVLDKNNTYIFELVSPFTRVVLEYPNTDIYHIGTRNNITQEEIIVDIGIKKPKEYDIHTLEDALRVVEEICTEADRHEGFVVVDANWRRVKIKNMFYINSHYSRGAASVTNFRKILDILDKENIEELICYAPNIAQIFKYYDWQYYECIAQIRNYLGICFGEMVKCNGDRKMYAKTVIGTPYQKWAFKLFDMESPNIEKLIRTITRVELQQFMVEYNHKINYLDKNTYNSNK